MILELRDVQSGYGPFQVLRGISLELDSGQFGAILGPNGAGKSTTLRTISRFVNLSSGEIYFEGEPIHAVHSHELPSRGISFVSESLNLFSNMTVHENLLLGGYVVPPHIVREGFEFVFDLFPMLKEFRSQLAGTMSGGQRKMLAIARALMARPRLLLIDEPSLGLAPAIVTRVFEVLRQLHQEGLTILLVEQHVVQALALADLAWVLEDGSIKLSGSAADLRDNDYVREAYLGV